MPEERPRATFATSAAEVDAVAEVLRARTEDVWFDPEDMAAAVISRLARKGRAVPSERAAEVIAASIRRHTGYLSADAGMAFAVLRDLREAGITIP